MAAHTLVPPDRRLAPLERLQDRNGGVLVGPSMAQGWPGVQKEMKLRSPRFTYISAAKQENWQSYNNGKDH
ncbi:hypothetical protein [Pseudophaeobacter leonis]|uniref:hypothetical protein n=1 Tax=Pseudophaeobacter leonis TaxID=1144477 RepID=UPI00111BE0E7|nr:hypothetical protein [Pseudophaeobacter leonis]